MQYKYFTSYKGRNVAPGHSVQVYRNLKYKNEAVYSIRSINSGLVLGHATTLLLSTCNFVVSQVGRKRVLREKRRNVHAWIEGSFDIIHAGDENIFSNGIPVRYNPYLNETFVRVYEEGETGHILSANIVWIDETGVYASGL